MTKKGRPNCGHCKYFQIDGMFGLWCDKGLNWEEVEYCEYFERDMRGMTKEEIVDELSNISDENKKLKKENRKLQFELKECGDNKLFSRRELEKENEKLKEDKKALIEFITIEFPKLHKTILRGILE